MATPSTLAMPLSTVIRMSGFLSCLGERYDLGRQTVAVFEAVRHQIIDYRAEFAQRAHADRAGRCAVGVVVGDDQQALPRRDCVGEDRCHALDVVQAGQRRQTGDFGCELLRRSHAARGINARQQWGYAGAAQRGDRCAHRVAS